MFTQPHIHMVQMDLALVLRSGQLLYYGSPTLIYHNDKNSLLGSRNHQWLQKNHFSHHNVLNDHTPDEDQVSTSFFSLFAEVLLNYGKYYLGASIKHLMTLNNKPDDDTTMSPDQVSANTAKNQKYSTRRSISVSADSLAKTAASEPDTILSCSNKVSPSNTNKQGIMKIQSPCLHNPQSPGDSTILRSHNLLQSYKRQKTNLPKVYPNGNKISKWHLHIMTSSTYTLSAVLFFFLFCCNLVQVCHSDSNLWRHADKGSGCTRHELTIATDAKRECDPVVAAIGSSILASNGQDYNSTCRYFQTYVNCMEPTFPCTAMVQEFWENYNAYTTQPFNCSVQNSTVLPPPLHMNEVTPTEANHIFTDTESNASVKSMNNHMMFYCLIFLLHIAGIITVV